MATIVPDGGTNMSSGLDLGLDTIDRMRASGRTSRAILISDGLANQGDATPEGLLRRAGRAARGEYVLTTVGVGADFNEYLMSALADAGTGNYYYLNRSDDLGSVFAREFDAARDDGRLRCRGADRAGRRRRRRGRRRLSARARRAVP